MARSINVGRVNTEEAAQTQRELEKGDRRYYTPAEGRNELRVMPPPRGYEKYFHKVGFHYGIGPDDRMFPCPKISGARDTCALCSESDRLMRSKDEDDQADGKELRATKRYLICVIDVDKPKDKFQVWPAGVKAFREVNYYFSDPDWGDISDLEEGFNFIVTRKGSGLNTDYTVRVAKKASNFLDVLEERLGDAYADEMFDDLPKLDEFLDFASDTDMENALNGVSTETKSKKKKDEEDEDETEPRAPRSRRSAPKDEDEDEDEKPRSRRAAKEDEDEDDEEEVAKQTRSSSRASSRAAKDDDDDDDDDDDEAEEEEKPASRSTRSSGRGGTTSAGRGGNSRLRRGLRD